MNKNCFIYGKPGYFARNSPKKKRSKYSIHFIEEIDDHKRIYISKEDDLELVFSLEEGLMEDTLFSIYVYD